MRNNFLLKSFLVCFLAYCVALAVAWYFISEANTPGNLLRDTFYADVIATIIIFIFSLIASNASMYDPYWSVAPMVIILFWNGHTEVPTSSYNVLLVLAFFVWGIRLTFNWARGWKGLKHEDWRYVQLRNQTGIFYPLVNLFGIHLFPTIMVLLGMIPAYYAVFSHNQKYPLLNILGFIICIIATAIEFIADEQQKKFKSVRKSQSEFYQARIWKYSRHPNYFGEVLFWWGIYLFGLAANPQYWWTITCPVVMTCMFVFISIPMMEKHMIKKNPDYLLYQKKVAAFLPMNIFRR